MNIEQIKTLRDAYCAHAGLKPSTVGAYAVNDGKFFQRIEGGGGCTVATAEKVGHWFSENWPVDLQWPRSIPRPAKSPKSKEAA